MDVPMYHGKDEGLYAFFNDSINRGPKSVRLQAHATELAGKLSPKLFAWKLEIARRTIAALDKPAKRKCVELHYGLDGKSDGIPNKFKRKHPAWHHWLDQAMIRCFWLAQQGYAIEMQVRGLEPGQDLDLLELPFDPRVISSLSRDSHFQTLRGIAESRLAGRVPNGAGKQAISMIQEVLESFQLVRANG